MKTYSLSTVKAKLSELLNEVEDFEEIRITRSGENAGVLINPHELDALKETIEILSDPDLMRQIEASHKSRRHYTLEEVFGDDE